MRSRECRRQRSGCEACQAGHAFPWTSSRSATVEIGACAGGTTKDETAKERAGTAGAFASASGCIRHSSREERCDGVSLLHSPDGLQQAFAVSVGSMKYCVQDRQPPHSNVAVSTATTPNVEIFLST